jgi:hypothetical protein
MTSVSVIVPTFREPRLAATLASLRSEVKGRAQIVVIDNAQRPEDQVDAVTPNLRAAFPEVVWLEEKTPGAYVARVRGIKEAKGDILAMLDADCVPLPGWFRAGVQSASPTHVLAGPVEIAPGDSLVEQYEALLGIPQEQMARKGRVAMGNVWLPRPAYEDAGGFDVSVKSSGEPFLIEQIRQSGCSVRFVPEMGVIHPARRKLGELRSKARRIYGGIRMHHTAQGVGPIPQAVFAVRCCVPDPRVVRSVVRQPGMSIRRKIAVLAVHAMHRIWMGWYYARNVGYSER